MGDVAVRLLAKAALWDSNPDIYKNWAILPRSGQGQHPPVRQKLLLKKLMGTDKGISLNYKDILQLRFKLFLS
jgi:hypothetical protein